MRTRISRVRRATVNDLSAYRAAVERTMAISERPARTPDAVSRVMPDGLLNSFEPVNLGQEAEQR